MPKLLSSLAAAGAVLGLSSLAAAPASALAAVTFVSGKGADTGACAAPASACRTFQYALGQTIAGGEIKALDPANYFFVMITKSITITGVEGASIIRGTAGDAITINAGIDGVVHLRGLELDGFNKIATNGVKLNSAASLTIRNCAVRNFSSSGIRLHPTTALKFLIADAVSADNGFAGVQVFSEGAGSAKGVLDHVVANRNQNGVYASGGAFDVTAVNSVASDNGNVGFSINGGTLRLSHSTATGNSYGVDGIAGTARSAGNNFINGNSSLNVIGLTNDGTY